MRSQEEFDSIFYDTLQSTFNLRYRVEQGDYHVVLENSGLHSDCKSRPNTNSFTDDTRTHQFGEIIEHKPEVHRE